MGHHVIAVYGSGHPLGLISQESLVRIQPSQPSQVHASLTLNGCLLRYVESLWTSRRSEEPVNQVRSLEVAPIKNTAGFPQRFRASQCRVECLVDPCVLSVHVCAVGPRVPEQA